MLRAAVLTSACIALLTLVSEARVRGRRHSPQRTIDVVVLANPTYAAGVAAAINSSRVHSSAAIRFYVGYDGDPLLFKKYLDCVGVDGADVIVRRPVELVDRSDIPKAPERHDQDEALDKTRLANAANYARFLIPKTFPEIKVAWYLDTDTLPIHDLAGVEHANFSRSGRLIQPALRDGTIEPQFDRAVLPIYKQRTGRTFHLEAPSWNAGVWLADFSQWEKLHIAEEAVFWVTQANEFSAKGQGRLWKLNTQPIMYLLFHDAVKRPAQFLSHKWNCESRDLHFNQKAPPGCHVIHWNGGEKPWDSDAKGHQFWRKFLPRFDEDGCRALVGDATADAANAPANALRHAAAYIETIANVGDGINDLVLGTTELARAELPPSDVPSASPPVANASGVASNHPVEPSDPHDASVAATVLPVLQLGEVSSDGGAIGVIDPEAGVTAAEPAAESAVEQVVEPSGAADGDGAGNKKIEAVPADTPTSQKCFCVVDCSYAAATSLASLYATVCDAASSMARNPEHSGCPVRDTPNPLFQLPFGDSRPVTPQAISASQSASEPPAPSPTPSSAHGDFPPVDHIDIVLLTDSRYAVGAAAVINAARHYHAVPVRVFVGVDGPVAAFSEYLSCVGVAASNVTIRPIVPLFDMADMPKAVIAGRERLQKPSNYARFTIHKTFPELGVAFYLDVDTLPVADLSDAVAAFIASGAMIKPSGRLGKPVSYAFHPDFADAYRAHYGSEWDGEQPSFNGGVFVADFAQWGRENVDTEALYWVQANAARVNDGKPPLWDLATQPLLYAIFNRALGQHVIRPGGQARLLRGDRAGGAEAASAAPAVIAERDPVQVPSVSAPALVLGADFLAFGSATLEPEAAIDAGAAALSSLSSSSSASPSPSATSTPSPSPSPPPSGPDWSLAFLRKTWNCKGSDACISPLCRVLHWYHEGKPWSGDTPGHALWAAHVPMAALKPQCAADLLRRAP